MKTKLRKMRIVHIRKNANVVTLTDWKGNSFDFPELKNCLKKCPSNLILIFKPVLFTIKYAASTNIVIEIKVGKTPVYSMDPKKFEKLQHLFDTHTETEAEIELSLRHYNDKDALLCYNLNCQTNDVFKFREEILLRYYRDEIPHLVSRIKLENDLICALTSSWHFFPRKTKKEMFKECLEKNFNLLAEYPNFIEWCLQEMDELDKLYRKDKRNKCHSDLSKIVFSQVIKHTSPLLPLSISDEKIQEYVSSYSHL